MRNEAFSAQLLIRLAYALAKIDIADDYRERMLILVSENLSAQFDHADTRTPFVLLPSLCCQACGEPAERTIGVSLAWFLLQVSAETLRGFGFEHPMGEGWRGFQDIDPATLPRERIVEFLDKVQPEMVLAVVPHGTPGRVAEIVKAYVDAGLRVPKILDYGAMAGQKYAEASAANVRATEDELLRLCGAVS